MEKNVNKVQFFKTIIDKRARKKCGIAMMRVFIFCILLCGCGTGKSQEIKQKDSSEISEKEIISEDSNSEAISSSSDISFEELSKKAYSYCSGAGGWSEDFVIQKDGSFSGNYHDSDMGDSGDDYPNGTRYISGYSGYFTDLTKLNDTVYEMKLADISYNKEPGTEEYSDGFHYVYTESLCFEDTDILTIYLPGTPINEIPEEVYWWLSSTNNSETELTMIALANLPSQIGMYSYDKMDSLEDAEVNYNSYKESYDYYSDLATASLTTVEMVENTQKMYEVSDECLNYIWTIIKYNVSEDRYEAILTEQRAWIAQKEAKGKEISESDGGSLAPVDYNIVMADMTMERCQELIDYLR